MFHNTLYSVYRDMGPYTAGALTSAATRFLLRMDSPFLGQIPAMVAGYYVGTTTNEDRFCSVAKGFAGGVLGNMAYSMAKPVVNTVASVPVGQNVELMT